MPASDAPRGGLRVALTGGLAAGKSTVERILEREGAMVLDTDRVAHRLLRRGGPAFDAVVEAFGTDILDASGEVDRGRLGERVFADPARLGTLNALVHPGVRREVATWLEEQGRAGRDAVVSVPLLFEAGMEQGWDAVVCVVAPLEQVRERLRGRGLSDAQAEARLAAQWPMDEKARRSDLVIENAGTLEELTEAVERMWRELTHKEQAHDG